MKAGNLLRFAWVLLTAILVGQVGLGAARAANRSKKTVTDERDEATLRHLFAPEADESPYLRIARPFDTGPQMDRHQVFPPPLDVLQPGQPGTAADPRPFRIPPPAPELFDPSPFPQAYECDSYEGRAVQLPEPPKWLPFAWLWPFSNGQWTWVAGNGDTLGFVEFEKRFMFANPLYAPFRIIPGFMTRYVSGPTTTDLPGQLDEFSIELASTYQLGQVWTLDAGFRPTLNTDLNFVNGDSFRWQGHAVFARQLSPTTQGVVGFVYLDREDIPALPVVGWVWQPNSGMKMEFVFPRPRLAMAVGPDPSECGWVYLKGELGGNSWTVLRESGAHDVATYRDIRVILGYETPFTAGLGMQFEVGWVTARKLMYQSGTPDYFPPDTFMLRAGFSF